MNDAVERLAWALEAERGQSAIFGARISSARDLGALIPMLGERGVASVALDAVASRTLVLAIIEGHAQFPDADAIILIDALASLPSELRHRANRSREVWLQAGRCFIFAESAAGSPETLVELRDFQAVFRDVVDLRPDVGDEDHMWDTGGTASLEALSSRMPTVTKGATLIVGGRVHHKKRPVVRCPDCDGDLRATTVCVRFEHASPETAVQAVRGYQCGCGAQWPEPRAMRSAHARAFGVGPQAEHDIEPP